MERAFNRHHLQLLRLLAGAFVLSSTLPARAGASEPRETISLQASPGASLELDGDSTLHRYSAKARAMTVNIGLDATRVSASAATMDVEALIRGHFITTVELIVLVDNLSSGERGLDDNLRKALKSADYKVVRFQMSSYDISSPSRGGMAFSIRLHGQLSLAGVERLIDVDADAARLGDGLRFTGDKDLLMTDYGIKPPTLMLGAIKTADRISVKFNVTIKKGTK